MGTKEGGERARDTNFKKYGDNYYRGLGAIGGRATGVKKGFASNPALASMAGAKGGRISRRGKSVNDRVNDEITYRDPFAGMDEKSLAKLEAAHGKLTLL